MVGQLTWETRAPATYIFLDKSKTNKRGKWELLALWEGLVASLENWTQWN